LGNNAVQDQMKSEAPGADVESGGGGWAGALLGHLGLGAAVGMGAPSLPAGMGRRARGPAPRSEAVNRKAAPAPREVLKGRASNATVSDGITTTPAADAETVTNEVSPRATGRSETANTGIVPASAVKSRTETTTTETGSRGMGLPSAVEIGDRGPADSTVQSIDSVLNSSQVEPKNQEAIQEINKVVPTPLSEDVVVHMDRPAWTVARTYNADVAIIGVNAYVSREVEERVIDILYPPVHSSSEVIEGDLIDIEYKPPFTRYEDSEVLVTHGGYTIEMKDSEVIIYDDKGSTVTRIWGDPHVDENGDGKDEWHFGNDSTFILPDGTKICLDTEPNSAGEYYVVGVDVLSGSDRFHYGTGDKAGMTQDAQDWDRAHKDEHSDGTGGTFALGEGNQWARQAKDGNFYDITDESWAGYQSDRDVDFSTAKKAKVSAAAAAVAGDAHLNRKAGGSAALDYRQRVAGAQRGQQTFFPNGIDRSTRRQGHDNHYQNPQKAPGQRGVLLAGSGGPTVAPGQVNTRTEQVEQDLRSNARGSEGNLVRVYWRPPCARYQDSIILLTHGAYTIELKDHEVFVYDQHGDLQTRIWGDPHVDEGGDGKDDWHFGDDSTFVLPDGTKLCLDTEPNSNGEWVVQQVNVLAGNDHYNYKAGGKDGSMTQDAKDWDMKNADRSKARDAGVFVMLPGGQWAMQAPDGNYYRVSDESWKNYQQTRDVTFDASQKVELNPDQIRATDSRKTTTRA
jgi:hypothetical protein